jgi:hypothetical protein
MAESHERLVYTAFAGYDGICEWRFMQVEIRLRSTVESKTNRQLQQEILSPEARQELERILSSEAESEDVPPIETAEISPERAFPGATEAFLITVAIGFGTGVAIGFSKGAGEAFGKEVGKPIGEKAGKIVGARIRAWLQRRWPDAEIVSVEAKK